MNACVENVSSQLPVAKSVAQGVSVSSADFSHEHEKGAAAPEKRSWFPSGWLGASKARAAEKTPHIVHVDVDAFFASVEQVLNPKLRGTPVLVGRGVVASASYEAKFRGVKTAMSFQDALRSCPKATVVPGQYEHYADFAERVRRVLETYTPTVETAALDDFYLDFADTERLYSNFEETLRRLQEEMLRAWNAHEDFASCNREWRKIFWRRCRWKNSTASVTPTRERWRSEELPLSGTCERFQSRC
jgi:hypothetical protein